MRLYIIRHADPDYENDTITEQGHREAQALARRMQGYELTHIFCSPLGRAKATMQYTAAQTHIKPEIEEWTQELSWLAFNAPHGETVPWDIPGEILLQPGAEHSRLLQEEGYEADQEKINNTLQHIARDSDTFLARFGLLRKDKRYFIEKEADGQVAVFCHGGFGLTWLAHLLQVPYYQIWAGFWLPPTSVTTILFEKRSEHYVVPRCISCGDTSHLYAEEHPIQPRGLKANIY